MLLYTAIQGVDSMFNETSMYGFHVGNKDEKNRVFVPSFTGVQKSDELVIVKYRGFYKIISKATLDAKLKTIEDEIMSLVKSGSISQVAALEQYRDSLILDVVRSCTVDGQKRINIGNLYEDTKKVTLLGARDSVYLMDDEAYTKLNEESRYDDQVKLGK